MNMPTLTARQAQILKFIKKRIAEGVPPSLVDIADHFGFASRTGARCHVIALEKKGFIERDSLKSRTIRVVEPVLHRHDGGLEDFSDLFARGNAVMPLLGAPIRYVVLNSRGKMLATIWRVG